jgi:hypothetical protein
MTAATQEMDTIVAQLEALGITQWDRFDIAKHGKCSVDHACYLIWDHTRSQRNLRPQNRPSKRFHRMAGYRTRAARYQTGERVADLSDMVHSIGSDIDCRTRSMYADLDSVLQSNPVAAAAWSNQLQLVQLQLQVTVQNLLSV